MRDNPSPLGEDFIVSVRVFNPVSACNHVDEVYQWENLTQVSE